MNPFRVSDEGGFWRARQPAIYSAARAIKPTEVGRVGKERNHDKMSVNKGRFQIRGCPRRGDRGGDGVKCASQRGLSLKKGSSGVIQILHSASTTCTVVQEECRRIEEFSNYFWLKMAGKFAPRKGQNYRSQNSA